MVHTAGPGGWLAGIGEAEITPSLGVDMTGYGGRPGPADRVLDRLHVRALALQVPGAEPVVLTGADLLGLSRAQVEQVRSALADTLPPERLLLNHSHTHAGPTTAPLRAMGRPDPQYCDDVVRRTAGAVRQALRDLKPSRLFYGTSATNIGANRREVGSSGVTLGFNPRGAYDPTVYVLRVEEEDGSPRACWFSHGTHPVVMGRENTGLSAEWPGAAADVLRRVLHCPAVFAQGCCGDINPVRRGDHAVVRSVGRELAGAALVAWERAEPLVPDVIATELETVLLPQACPTIDEAEAALEDAARRLQEAQEPDQRTGEAVPAWRRSLLQAMVEWAEDYLEVARAGAAPPVPMDVQGIRIGDVCVVGTAAETFVEIGQEIQRRSPFPRTVALGYTNGCYGYLPTEKAIPLGGYEVAGAFKYYGTLMVTPDCERLTLEAADRVMTACRGHD